MSIPASQIVEINPRLLQPGGVDLEFNGLFLSSSNSFSTGELVLPFSSPEAVATKFGATSLEAKAATRYFLGYANSFRKPRVMYVAKKASGTTLTAITTQMSSILDVTRNWVTFTTVEPVTTDAEKTAYAQWATNQEIDYLYVDHCDSIGTAGTANSGAASAAAAFTTANIGATCGILGDVAGSADREGVEYAAMLMGAAASIDFDRRQGTITFAFKRQEGLPANVLDGQTASNLEDIRWNFIGDYATRNDQFVFLYPGAMFGSWRWIDPYINAVWLKNALQVSIMAGLNQCPRVPYNDAGYTLIRSWCQDPINRALHSGIIDVGVTLSESQKAEVAREVGRDISAELYTDGYYLQVLDPSPAVRQRRESPEVSLWFTYAGSCHRVTMASTALV